MASFGDFLITTLYDERYYQATWILPILAVGLWPLMLSLTSDKALFAIGNPNYVALGNMFKFIYMLIGLLLAFSIYGVLGAVIVIALNDFPFYLVVSYGLWRENLATVKQDLLATGMLLGLLTVVLGVRYSLGWGLPIDRIL
jgi:O-antigen/teichoic acid export membrane protein